MAAAFFHSMSDSLAWLCGDDTRPRSSLEKCQMITTGSVLQLPQEPYVAERLQGYARSAEVNPPDVCNLEPKAFVEKVMRGGMAMDDGDWVQPLYRHVGDAWLLDQLEVLYRLKDAQRVPFPAFVNFVKEATDQGKTSDPELREAFRCHALASLKRVDERLSLLDPVRRLAMAQAGLLTSLNFTAKQLDGALTVHLENSKLLSLEETEYDQAPESLSLVRQQIWQRFGALALDDVKPTLAEVMAGATQPCEYSPPLAPGGRPFKPLLPQYNHDFAFARCFITDFREARQKNREAKGSLKFDEEFCCYLVGVGHAPFAREVMSTWHRAHPEASAAVRRTGLALVREALDASMDIVLEVSFEDSDVQWLHEALPDLQGRLVKQGGLSGAAALPHSLFDAMLLGY